MKTLIRAVCVLLVASLGNVHAKKSKASKAESEKISKCLKLKGEKVRTDCLVAIYTPQAGEWKFSEVTKSPINDAPTVSASLRSDAGVSEIVMGCYEGKLFTFADLKLYVSSMRNYAPPIVYRIDSEPAIDCTDYEPPAQCSKWEISASSDAVGIWGNPDEFIQEIKDAKKLTVRLSNHSGDQKTAVFTLKDVAATFEKVKSICTFAEPAATEGEATP